MESTVKEAIEEMNNILIVQSNGKHHQGSNRGDEWYTAVSYIQKKDDKDKPAIKLVKQLKQLGFKEKSKKEGKEKEESFYLSDLVANLYYTKPWEKKKNSVFI